MTPVHAKNGATALQLMMCQHHYEKLLATTTLTYPEECCGLLVGFDQSQVKRIITHIVPCQNSTLEPLRRSHFKIEAPDILRADRLARTHRCDLIGIYHSHPDQSPQPSAQDLHHAIDGWSYVILTSTKNSVESMQAWRFNEKERSFSEEVLTIAG
jgi:proteasome lid subunit RPN8/RPN11